MDFENLKTDREDPTNGYGDEGDSEKHEVDIGPREVEKVKSLIAQLQPIADKAGCDVAELVEKYAGEDSDEESEGEGKGEGDGGKLALIVARMKSKANPTEE